MTTEAIRNDAPAADERDVPLPLRSDTFLGVFEAIGQDLGFSANWLRVPFAALLLWNPTAILASYLFLGCVVALTRWLFPASQRGVTAKAEAAPAAPAPAGSANEADRDLPIAA